MVFWYLVFILWFSVIYFVILFSWGVGLRLGFFLKTWIIYPLGDNFTLFGAIPFRSGFPPQTYPWYSGLSLSHSTPPRHWNGSLHQGWWSAPRLRRSRGHSWNHSSLDDHICSLRVFFAILHVARKNRWHYEWPCCLALRCSSDYHRWRRRTHRPILAPLCGCLYSFPLVLRDMNFVPPLTADCLIG